MDSRSENISINVAAPARYHSYSTFIDVANLLQYKYKYSKTTVCIFVKQYLPSLTHDI